MTRVLPCWCNVLGNLYPWIYETATWWGTNVVLTAIIEGKGGRQVHHKSPMNQGRWIKEDSKLGAFCPIVWVVYQVHRETAELTILCLTPWCAAFNTKHTATKSRKCSSCSQALVVDHTQQVDCTGSQTQEDTQLRRTDKAPEWASLFRRWCTLWQQRWWWEMVPRRFLRGGVMLKDPSLS